MHAWSIKTILKHLHSQDTERERERGMIMPLSLILAKNISLFHLAFLSRFKNWEIYLTCMKWVIHIFSHLIKVLGLVENQSDWYLGKIWKNHIPWPALVCPISLSCSIVISFVFVVLFWYLCSIWLLFCGMLSGPWI